MIEHAQIAPAIPSGDRSGARLLALIIDYGAIGGVVSAMSSVPVLDRDSITVTTFILYIITRDALFGGRSLGKLMCGLIVIDEATGCPVPWWQACLRQLLFFGSLAAAGFLSYLIMGGHPDRGPSTAAVVMGGLVLEMAREISKHGQSYCDRGARARVVKKAEYDATQRNAPS